MYKNVFGEKVSRARYKEMVRAQKNRREIVAAQLPRREMIKMGLLTGAGYLVAKSGLSARAEAPIPVGQPASLQASCAFQPFTEPLNIPPIKQPVASLSPAPHGSAEHGSRGASCDYSPGVQPVPAGKVVRGPSTAGVRLDTLPTAHTESLGL